MKSREYLHPFPLPIDRLVRTDRPMMLADRQPRLRGLEALADKLVWAAPLAGAPDEALKQYLLARIRLDVGR